MSVRRRGQRFVVDYYPQGRKGLRKRITLPAAVQGEEEARAIEGLLRKASRDQEEIPLSSAATVKELFPHYLEWFEIHRAESTCRDLEWAYEKHIRRLLGNEKVEDLNVHHINLYKKIRKAEHHFKKSRELVSNRTINKELSYFSGFLRWVRKNENIRLKNFEIEALPYRRPTPITLSFKEAVRIIESAEPVYKIYFLCLFTLGLRKKEAAHLKPEDFDLANRIVRIVQKGGSYKTLPLNNWLLSYLKRFEPMKHRGRYLFLNEKTGRPILNIRKALARAAGRAGIEKKVNPHLLRHSIATILMGKDVNLRLIQNYLGHSKISTTEFYTHVVTEHLRTAADTIDRSFKIYRRDYMKANKNK